MGSALLDDRLLRCMELHGTSVGPHDLDVVPSRTASHFAMDDAEAVQLVVPGRQVVGRQSEDIESLQGGDDGRLSLVQTQDYSARVMESCANSHVLFFLIQENFEPENRSEPIGARLNVRDREANVVNPEQ